MILAPRILMKALFGDLLLFDAQEFLSPAGEAAIAGPDSVSWRVFGNPVALAVGGIAAVLLELGERRVRAGVWDHSSFRRDPGNRIRRTAQGALITAFAARSHFETFAQRVNAIHRHVQGTTAEGQDYRADDPELLRWVHATAAYAFLEAYAALVHPVPSEEADCFYAESAVGAAYYGVAHPPRTQSEMGLYLASMRPLLSSSKELKEFLSIMRTGPVLPPATRWLQPILVRAAIETLPPSLRASLGLEGDDRPTKVERRLLRAMAWLAEHVRIPDDPRTLAVRRIADLPPSGRLAAEVRPRS